MLTNEDEITGEPFTLKDKFLSFANTRVGSIVVAVILIAIILGLNYLMKRVLL